MFDAMPQTAEQKITFMQQWYRWFHSNTETWGGDLGSEISYLLGAIMNDTFILVTSQSALVSLLRTKKVTNTSPIWKYVHFFDN